MGDDWKPRGWQKRHTLSLLGFIGLALMYALRFNLSIGIVAMVDYGNPDLHHRHSKDNDHGAMTNESICPALEGTASTNDNGNDNGTHLIIKQHAANLISGHDKAMKFQWSEKDQGLILGSFFWGYILTQVPGGMLAQRLGGEWVVSLGLLVTGLLSIILPWAAMVGGLNALITIRILQGVAEGVMFPAFMVLLSKWTAPEERASISTICFSGMPFGTAVTMILSGHLISSFGWPAVFYAPGILSVVWFLAWTFLVYSSPADHPTISASEHNHIEGWTRRAGLRGHHQPKEVTSLFDIPWKDILVSLPFWAIFISQFTFTWGHNILHSEGPKFLHSVLHFEIHENAYLAAAPHLAQLVFGNLVVQLSDYLVSNNWLTLTTSRKLCSTIGQTGTGLACLGLIFAGCSKPLVIFFYILIGTLGGATCGGFLVNPIDISPVYAGVLEGVINCLSNFTGFGAPYVAGLILYNDPSIYGWRYVFLIPLFANLIGNFCFVLFGSTEVQPWNNKTKKEQDRPRAESMDDVTVFKNKNFRR